MIEDKELLELCNHWLSYNPKTGHFINIRYRGPKAKKGTLAGTVRPDGYLSIFLQGNRYLLHRLAFLMSNKYLPQLVDHINNVKADNKASNLRACTYSENNSNCGPRVRNKSGYKGVFFHSKKWHVSLQKNKKKMHFGVYDCKHEAARNWNLAARMYHGPFAYTNIIKEK